MKPYSYDFPNDLTPAEENFIEDWVEENTDSYMKGDIKEAVVAFLKYREAREVDPFANSPQENSIVPPEMWGAFWKGYNKRWLSQQDDQSVRGTRSMFCGLEAALQWWIKYLDVMGDV